MDKVEVRAVIKYFCKKGMSPKEIHDKFIKTLGNESPFYVRACAQSDHMWQEKKPVWCSYSNRHRFWGSSVYLDQYQGCPRSPLDVSPECWPKIKRRTNLIFLNISCLCMKMTLRNLCFMLCRKMRPGSITWILRPKSRVCNGSIQAHPLLRN